MKESFKVLIFGKNVQIANSGRENHYSEKLIKTPPIANLNAFKPYLMH